MVGRLSRFLVEGQDSDGGRVAHARGARPTVEHDVHQDLSVDEGEILAVLSSVGDPSSLLSGDTSFGDRADRFKPELTVALSLPTDPPRLAQLEVRVEQLFAEDIQALLASGDAGCPMERCDVLANTGKQK